VNRDASKDKRISFAKFLLVCYLLEGFAGRIARERRCHSTVALHAHIPSEERAIGLLVATETQSHHIDMIITLLGFYSCYYNNVTPATTILLLLLLQYCTPVTTILYSCYYNTVTPVTTILLLLLLQYCYSCYYNTATPDTTILLLLKVGWV
jgi:hypothetical protein